MLWNSRVVQPLSMKGQLNHRSLYLNKKIATANLNKGNYSQFFSIKLCPFKTIQNQCFHWTTKSALWRKLVLALSTGIYQIHMALSKKMEFYEGAEFQRHDRVQESRTSLQMYCIFPSRIIIFWLFFQLIFYIIIPIIKLWLVFCLHVSFCSIYVYTLCLLF